MYYVICLIVLLISCLWLMLLTFVFLSSHGDISNSSNSSDNDDSGSNNHNGNTIHSSNSNNS